jgi:hypothetical protein
MVATSFCPAAVCNGALLMAFPAATKGTAVSSKEAAPVRIERRSIFDFHDGWFAAAHGHEP